MSAAMAQVPTPLPPPSQVPKGESATQRRERAAKVIARLDAAMPEAKIELDYTNPLELLVAVILSAQSTDRGVNRVSPKLFAAFPTPAHYAAVSPARLHP